MTIKTISISTVGHLVRIRKEIAQADRTPIVDMVRATGFFDAAEVAIAGELVDERLSKGAASGYDFVLAQGPDQRLLGYTCYGEIPCTVGSYDIYWIVVDPAYQRNGIGIRLMNETRQLISQRLGRKIFIDTSGRPQYATTRAFYGRCGFLPVAEFADFYAINDSKIVFSADVETI